jgi:hypothetical protein
VHRTRTCRADSVQDMVVSSTITYVCEEIAGA